MRRQEHVHHGQRGACARSDCDADTDATRRANSNADSNGDGPDRRVAVAHLRRVRK